MVPNQQPVGPICLASDAQHINEFRKYAYLTLLYNGRGPVCFSCNLPTPGESFIVHQLYRIGLFSSSILSSPWALHQTAWLPSWPFPGANRSAIAGLVVWESLSLSIRHKRCHLGLFLLANCCTESQIECFFVGFFLLPGILRRSFCCHSFIRSWTGFLGKGLRAFSGLVCHVLRNVFTLI